MKVLLMAPGQAGAADVFGAGRSHRHIRPSGDRPTTRATRRRFGPPCPDRRGRRTRFGGMPLPANGLVPGPACLPSANEEITGHAGRPDTVGRSARNLPPAANYQEFRFLVCGPAAFESESRRPARCPRCKSRNGPFVNETTKTDPHLFISTPIPSR